MRQVGRLLANRGSPVLEKFNPKYATKITRDEQRNPRDLIHHEHVPSKAASARGAAREYLHDCYGLIGTKVAELRNLHRRPERSLTKAGIEYRLYAEKPQFDTTTVAYYQTVFGLPIWEAGLAVHVKHASAKRAGHKDAKFHIVGAQTTRHAKVRVRKPPAKALAQLKKLDAQTLAKVLGIGGNKSAFDPKSLRILHRRLMVYRYEKAKRFVRPQGRAKTRRRDRVLDRPTMPLPPVNRPIADGRHYVVAALDFSTDSGPFGTLHWIALVEAQTLCALYLRALVDHVCGLVFDADPMTFAGGPRADANSRALNRLRRRVNLDGLERPRAGRCSLNGEIIAIRDFEPPEARPPTVRAGATFAYPARTNKFAAVNAYYHCDRFFRVVEDLGFARDAYFRPTRFPVPVDHRGRIDTQDGIEINARCLGNSTAEGGLLNVRFALADKNNLAEPLGLACDWRVVLHELGGHGILWNHINYGLFKFAHSTGDSLAAILNDPDSWVRDDERFVTFPWIRFLKRRHDRKIAQGWAWGGTKDLGVDERRVIDPKGYQSEQILSTTHFRIYRAIGGDADEANMRRFASRFVAYLILRTVGSLTPAHSPEHAANYAAALMLANRFDWTSEGHAGGAYGKVIRWAFEKQGLYQPRQSKGPVTREGAPPPVDLYIEDGRRGEYQFQPHYWNCRAIWNRHAADGGGPHQEPVPGATNFAYVKIKNRGKEKAAKVTVKAFHCAPSAGGVYPTDWQPMTTPELGAREVPPHSAAEITVGPFAWRPTDKRDSIIMVAAALGDGSNIDHFDQSKTIPEWRLVPHDNNIGQRAMFTVEADGAESLGAALDGAQIAVKNPHHKRAHMVVKAVLPPFLAKRGWRLMLASSVARGFSLAPHATRNVVLRLKPGKKFTASQVRKAHDRNICIEVFADDLLVGGMTYALEPRARSRR
jgi:zinc metalloprotease ZmpB